MTIAAGVLSGRAAAQQAGGEYAFHVYADPIYGDDAIATALNPQVAASDVRKHALGGYPTTSQQHSGPRMSARLPLSRKPTVSRCARPSTGGCDEVVASADILF